MNNRQKAKHFKKLYEQMLPKTQSEIIKSHSLKQYKFATLVSYREIAEGLIPLEYVDEHASRLLLRSIRDVVKANMIAEEEFTTDHIKYSVDVWFRN